MKRPWPASSPSEHGFDTLQTYGKFAFTDDKVLLTLLPRPLSTTIATTAMRAKISAYSTKLWPFRDFSPRYILWRVLFISFTSLIFLMFTCSTTRRTYVRAEIHLQLTCHFVRSYGQDCQPRGPRSRNWLSTNLLMVITNSTING